ncbi:SipW-dependent-type signal peptide-containing protein [Microbacterium sp. LS_15]|uniref:SipW-dependent-type signal peptide-containing protein n=1 Tax=Microbacterium sp. LS_15 TaxID=3055790 RepID=UPI0035C175BA
MVTTDTRRTDSRRKVLAVLAGGVVLGVGVGVTLAAWNDSEFATGTFGAGSFNLEGSTTSATTGYDDHNIDNGDAAASLVFQLPAVAASMSPGDVVYAPFWVRLDATTTNAATLVPAGITAGTGGNEANLSYTVTTIGAAATCGAGATGTVVASGATLSAQTGATSVPLAEGTAPGTAGAPVQLCFAVTAGAALTQGATATATWEFTATSVSD